MKRGSALIIVLWVVALLSVLIGGFAFDMHVEAKIVSHLRKRLKAEYLSKAGMEYAQALFIHSQEIKGKADTDETKGKYWYDAAKRLHQGYAIMGLTAKLGEGAFVLDILPEPALRNINALKDEDWECIFKLSGVPEEKWSELIDCLNDWRDPDDQPNMDGAETDDYYARLDPPYKARGHRATATSKPSKLTAPNQMVNLDTIEELLLIKGWNHAILYGGYAEDGDTNTPAMTGIADLLTASPEAGETVNINAASKRVLMTLPGIDSTLADAIIAEREQGGRQGLTGSAQISEDYFFTDVNNLFSRVSELSRLTPEEQQRLRTLGGTASSVLRVRSSGVVQGVEYRMTSTLGISASGSGARQLRR
ncbi:MAG: helix-hairpin-helix domain-containing protein [bacterium]